MTEKIVWTLIYSQMSAGTCFELPERFFAFKRVHEEKFSES